MSVLQPVHVALIQGLSIDGELPCSEGFAFPEGFPLFLTNDSDVISGLFSPHVIRDLGVLLTSDDKERTAVYSRSLFGFENSEERDEIQEAANFLGIVEVLLICMWLVKDHGAFVRYNIRETPRSPESSIITHGPGQGLAVRADWGTDTTPFSVPELKSATDYFEQLYLHPIERSYNAFETTTPGTSEEDRPQAFTKSWISQASFVSNRNLPLQIRLIRYLLQARRADDPAYRIANTMTCFETLLSTENIGLQHQLAERTALLLGKSRESRKTIYDEIKLGYDIRSKTVHGGTISPKKGQQIQTIAVGLDTLLRQTIQHILSSPDVGKAIFGTDEERKTFFRNLVLG